MGNYQSLQKESYSPSTNSTLTISPSSNNVMSSVGTHSCGRSQTVEMSLQHYPRAYETSYVQNRDLIADVSKKELQSSIIRGNFQSSLDANFSGSMNSFWTICPICNKVMSSVGTHSCGIRQTVGTSLQLYPRPYKTSSDQKKSKVLLTEIVNSTFKYPIQFLEHDTRECVDDVSFGLENGTRNDCVRCIPERCTQMDLHLTATKCSESNSDLFADMSKKELQSSLDEFRRSVKTGSHMVLQRDTLSYYHHMLVSDVDENSIRVIEYSVPEGTIDRIDTVSETSLGQIQYRTITFEELFQPHGSKVYLVYSERYPKTTEQLNAAMERAKSRIGEKMYSISHCNCEHFVTWALLGVSTSIQWIVASVWRRAAGDAFEKSLPVVVGGVTNLLLQKLDPIAPNVPPNEDPTDLSPPEDETVKRSRNDTVAPNQKCSKLSTILRGFNYCKQAGNFVLAILYLLLKLVIYYMKWDLSPGRHNIVIIMIVVFRTFIFIIGPRFQLLEIDKLLFQTYFMSREDIFREVFKIIFVLFAGMTRVSRDLTISTTCVQCLYQLTCYILAGIFFDAFIYPLFHILLIL